MLIVCLSMAEIRVHVERGATAVTPQPSPSLSGESSAVGGNELTGRTGRPKAKPEAKR